MNEKSELSSLMEPLSSSQPLSQESLRLVKTSLGEEHSHVAGKLILAGPLFINICD